MKTRLVFYFFLIIGILLVVVYFKFVTEIASAEGVTKAFLPLVQTDWKVLNLPQGCVRVLNEYTCLGTPIYATPIPLP